MISITYSSFGNVEIVCNNRSEIRTDEEPINGVIMVCKDGQVYNSS